MSNSLETLQGDIYGMLLETTDLQYISIFQERPRDATETVSLTDRINKALAGLVTRNGKAGVACIVMMPVVSVGSPNVPGPEVQIEIAVRVIELPSKNMNTSGVGTGSSAEEIAMNVLQLLHQWSPGKGAILTANGQAIRPADEGDGKVAYDVILSRNAGNDPVSRAVAPTISNAGGTITLTVPTGSIYYTTDGSYPSSSDTLYSTPFAPAAQSLVRCVTYRSGFQPSNISELQL